jgi:hypothetical protein
MVERLAYGTGAKYILGSVNQKLIPAICLTVASSGIGKIIDSYSHGYP